MGIGPALTVVTTSLRATFAADSVIRCGQVARAPSMTQRGPLQEPPHGLCLSPASPTQEKRESSHCRLHKRNEKGGDNDGASTESMKFLVIRTSIKYIAPEQHHLWELSN